MTKSDLIKELSMRIEGILKNQPSADLSTDAEKLRRKANELATKCVEIFFDSIKEALKSGDRIEIRGFGSFSLKTYKAYIGRNPKTGEAVEVMEKTVPIFKPSKLLKEMINQK